VWGNFIGKSGTDVEEGGGNRGLDTVASSP
jgi:hypothetical protein